MTTEKEERRAELKAMPKRTLARMCDEGITGPHGQKVQIWGAHPVITWTREEIIEAILDVEYWKKGGGIMCTDCGVRPAVAGDELCGHCMMGCR